MSQDGAIETSSPATERNRIFCLKHGFRMSMNGQCPTCSQLAVERDNRRVKRLKATAGGTRSKD